MQYTQTFKRTLFNIGGGAALALAVGPLTVVRADTPAILTANGSPTPFTALAGAVSAGTVGWSFTVGATPLTLTQLGLYSENSGLAQSHQVELWASGGGTPLVQTTILAGTASPLTNGYRYESVAPVTLSANATYVLGAFYGGGSSDPEIDQSTQTFVSGITFGQSLQTQFSPSQTFGYPGANAGLPQGIFGPTFQVASAAVPEPGSIALLGAGVLPLVGLALGRRRRKAAPLCA